MPIPGCTRSWDHGYALTCLIDDDRENENDDRYGDSELEKSDVSTVIDHRSQSEPVGAQGWVDHTYP